MPGRPSSTPQNIGATIPSEVFSARLSVAARPTPAASSCRGSRPTIIDTASRAASRSPEVNGRATAATWSCIERAATSGQARNPVRTAPTQPPGSNDAAIHPPPADTPMTSKATTSPVARRTTSGALSRLRCPSKAEIIMPTQVTGCPMRAYNAAGQPRPASIANANSMTRAPFMWRSQPLVDHAALDRYQALSSSPCRWTTPCHETW